MASMPDPTDPDGAKSQSAEMCCDCQDPSGLHYFTTVAQCIADGGTVFGAPFPCPVTPAEREALFAKKPGQ